MLAANGIGASTDTEAEFRELTADEVCRQTFSDYFRFSFTTRMDRDEALALSRKIEIFLESATDHLCTVYVGVRNSS